MNLLTSAEKRTLATRAETTYTAAFLAPWRNICDPLADAAVAALSAEHHPSLLTACQTAALHGDPACQAFMTTVNSTPNWVNRADFEAGRRMFRRNGVFTFLTGISVLVSSYGGYKDNKVLVLSDRLGEGDAFRRAVETAQFTLDVTAPNGLHVGSIGWQSILEVRLLHARVRQYCRRGGFDIASYDQPINQEAMCGANMLFSHGVIRALELLGIHVSDLEKESYHALWRYAGWLMGVDIALLPERHIEEAVLFECHQYDYQPDADTDRLFSGTVGGIVKGARTLPLWMALMGGFMLRSRAFVENFVGYTVNDKLRNHLALVPSVGWRLLFAGLRSVLKAISFGQRVVPGFGRISLTLQSRLMQKMVTTLSGTDPVQFNNVGNLG